MKTKNKSLKEKILNIVLDILIFLFGIVLLISIYNGIQIKILGNSYSNFFGYSVFEVQTGSMANTINIGDWIIVKSSKNIDIDDVVTYEQKGEFITHRVVESHKGTFVTKGDANNSKDDPISQEQIVGKVIKILPCFGLFRKTLFNPAVLIALIVTLYLVSFTFKKNKKDNTDETAFERKVDTMLEKVYKKIVSLFNKNKVDKDDIIIPKQEIKKEEFIIDPVPTKPEEPVGAEVKLDEHKEDSVESVNLSNYDDKYNMDEIKEEADKTEDEKEEELSKTICYRAISVDKSELDNTFLQIAENQVEDEVEPERVENEVEEEIPEEDESLIESNLEMLNKKRTKKFKNVIEKIMFIKSAELNEMVDTLNNNEKYKVNEATIKDEFIKAYIDGKYYNYCGDFNVEYNKKNMTVKIEDVIEKLGAKLSKSYKGGDKLYKEKVTKFQNMLMMIMFFEQGKDSITDLQSKKEFFKKKIVKYTDVSVLNNKEVVSQVNGIVKTQRIYQSMINYCFRKFDTNTFMLNLTPVTSKKNIQGVDLTHNIAFSKVYSDYIVDKTYSEGVVAEDKTEVLISLLLVQLTKDMLTCDFKKKYILYLPDTLYAKEKKLNKLLKSIDDEYAKNNIYLLIKYEYLINNKKLIKGLKKEGYRFVLVFDKTVDVKAKDCVIINVVDYIFMDKKAIDVNSMLPSIPEDVKGKIINDNIMSKVGNFGGE